jgi:DNA polymerase-4
VSDPTILHADADAFFASVEQRDDPSLLGRPVIVGPGVVMAASYEARARGVHSGMGASVARRLCPEAIVVPPRFRAYVEASRALFAIFERTAPNVEGHSLEEAFLDVSGLERIKGTPAEIAARLRSEVRAKERLAISVGVARTKVLAKMASGAAKPDGLIVVPPEREREFLYPLAVERIWGVGPSTAARLRELGIETVGRLAEHSEESLRERLGEATGRRLYAVAHFREPGRVRRGRARRSFGSQSALGRRPRSRRELEALLARLVERVARRMRRKGRAGRTVVLRLRFGDFTRASRSQSLPRPTATTNALLIVARRLLAASERAIAERGITLIGITITNLDGTGAGVQLELPLGPEPAVEALDEALDDLRERFGAAAVTRGPPRPGDREPRSFSDLG